MMAMPIDHLVVAMAREVRDRDFLLLGSGSLLPLASFLLAKLHHAPNAILFTGTGAFSSEAPVPITLSDWEVRLARSARYAMSMVQGVCELNGWLHARVLEFLRPAQLDVLGQLNTSLVRPDSSRTVRLPGAAGIPEILRRRKRIRLYLPRHDRRTLVQRVDYVTARLFGTEQMHADVRLFTELGVFRFLGPGRVVAEGLFPGVDADQVRSATGFPIAGLDEAPTLPTPSKEELHLLTTVVDPYKVRELEHLTGECRLEAIAGVLAAEKEGAVHEPVR